MNKQKIVAIIPARGGSKGIPNKNIRLLNGKPLIYYSIRNALESQYITDIIVSTDSPEIAVITKQMGVLCKWRDQRLCGDMVTLDEVICEATQNIDYDYVVTMQPTSPTLKVITLDKAILHCLEKQPDTLISVINRPHLSWRRAQGGLIPNYEKRLNRQELPENFLETGAFLIAKKETIDAGSRIGKQIDVYEITEEEAVDIDTYADLMYAEAIVAKKSVGIYVNGNNKRGVGHVYRALELADEFYSKPDIYFDSNQTDINIFGQTTHRLIPVDGIGELFELLKTKHYKYFINDILATPIDYMITLKKLMPETKIINFEDDGEGVILADLVFNALYTSNDLKQMKAGEQYYIAPKLFMFYEPVKIREKVEKVFISFGGADPQNYSDRLIDIISAPQYKDIKFTVVLGRAKANTEQLLSRSGDNIEILYDVANMPELMSDCDIGITSRGRTGYELALLGIPSIAMAQNKREEKHGFVCNENGFTYLGLNPSNNMIQANLDIFLKLNAQERKDIQEVLLSHNLRNGRKKVMGCINNL
ncbi:MAG: cytidyltransferase [Lachnospiraceae bacterium]|jgi:CMP-N-acetylneuraminic acid synthetase/spore coat polysaccharide biosynthesis predicted glycosyltransferase SpsG|nr:cytidyltransferase [Lachnospiraceae bacterium]